MSESEELEHASFGHCSLSPWPVWRIDVALVAEGLRLKVVTYILTSLLAADAGSWIDLPLGKFRIHSVSA